MSVLNTVIQVEHLSISYPKLPVIADISLNIYQNKVTAIVGANGSGKTTFLKSLNRMHEPDASMELSGKIECFGKNIYDRKVNLSRLHRQISFISTIPHLFPVSIYENIAYGVKSAGWHSKSETDRIVEIAIKNAGLWHEVKDKLHKPALNLSENQQQRLCIARALATQPRVLLIDEPHSALDAAMMDKMAELINHLRSSLTIVFVTRNWQQATRIADYIAIFHQNEKRICQTVEFGTTSQILTNAMDTRTSRIRDYVSL
ncbi:phosphate ABC transporter ATP-binding protein [Calothrix sp. 336/3]|uniref:phosphate ABC transporter ATP-binding protein n=1 Tax=Calothrix sp. 336/3 TaxID=1337936 RepID=UPI0004E46FD3|nr:ATP-binding cassette domain-containing protein [Calothrix sp. 336/3]AKG24170.1 phosphate ABC transporter ATP-binding protein [Calothrix sp. 336/3]